MKLLLILVSALMCAASATLAQTVVAPGTIPGAQTVVTPDMRNAGSPRAPGHDEKVPNLDRRDQKKLRKLGKVKPNASGTMKAN